MVQRQRIFEDEIIKRIKVLQNFIKKLNNDVRHIKGSKRSHSRTQPKEFLEQSDSKPERLRTADKQADPKVVESFKWELEVMEKKNEDRFK